MTPAATQRLFAATVCPGAYLTTRSATPGPEFRILAIRAHYGLQWSIGSDENSSTSPFNGAQPFHERQDCLRHR